MSTAFRFNSWDDDPRIDAALREALEFRFARSRLCGTLRNLPLRENPAWAYPFKGLGRRVNTLSRRRTGIGPATPPATSFGWAAYRERHRDAWIVVPRWFYALLWLWERRYTGHELLYRWGILVAPYDGCYYSEMRLRDWDKMPWSENLTLERGDAQEAA